MGYIESEEGISKEYVKDGSYQIELMGERYSGQASLVPFYDPKGTKIIN